MRSYRNKVTRFFLSLFFGFGGIAAGFLFPATSFSATFTVTPTSDADCSDFNCILQSALDTAENNGEADNINIAAGTYNTADNADNAFLYTPSTENFPLIINGAGTGKTILDGGNNTQVLFIDTTGLAGDSNANMFIENLTIQNGNNTDNSVDGGFGGGLCIFTVSANINIIDSKFMNNSALEGGGMDIVTDEGLITIIGNTFDNNRATFFGGGASIEATFKGGIRLKDNTFTRNSALSPSGDAAGGGVEIFTSFVNVELEDNRFKNNNADFSGGGALITAVFGANVTLINNRFEGNFVNSSSEDTDGGGASIFTDSGNTTLVNNVFINNFAFAVLVQLDAVGGGASLITDSGNIALTNNTFTLNTTFDKGGGLFVDVFSDDSTVDIYNSIFFDNTAETATTTGKGQDIFIEDDTDDNNIGAPVNVFNNNFSDFFSSCDNDPDCVQNISDGNNINVDPLFVNAANGDVHLKANSPVINKGTSSAPDLPVIDFEGNPRIDGPEPDIGADEFSEIINFLVSFDPVPSTITTTSDKSGCPSGFVGKFLFTSRLTNITNRPIDIIGDRSLSNLVIRVKRLTNGNLLLLPDGSTGGVGARLTVRKRGGFQDEILSPGEGVGVPFVICLKNTNRFRFFVDVLGIVQ